MQKYKQFSYEERVMLCYLLKQGKSKTIIAKELQRDRSTIYREIQSNSSFGEYNLYNANPAQKRKDARSKNSHKRTAITKRMKEYIKDKLFMKWSPEQIANRAKLDSIPMVSHEAIYQFIYDDKKEGGVLYNYLRRAHRTRRKRRNTYDNRGIIKDRISIEKRPAIVNNQKRYGDWEGDTIIGKNHQGAIVTLVERKSLFLKVKKVNKREAVLTAEGICSVMYDVKNKCHTITFDNGKEFAAHKNIEKYLEASIFFAHPYSAFERGCNENVNGLLRQYIPKSTDLSIISDDYLLHVQNEINNRPRKKLGFLTPNEIFSKFVALKT